MAHKNRERRADKKAREAAKEQELYGEESYADEDDDEDVKPKRRRGPHPAIIALIVTVIIVFGGFFGLNTAYKTMLSPVDPASDAEISVDIPEGSSTGGIAVILQEQGLLRNGLVSGFASEYFFKIFCKKNGYDGEFKYGTFSLKKNMSADEMAQIIIAGSALADTKKFTIPEGYNIKQIAEVLETDGIVSQSDFFDEVQNGVFDYDFLKDCPPGPERLEGFLYPDTYEVYADATAHDVIVKMLDEFNTLFKPEYYTRAQEMGMSVSDVVTMASIVERESVVPDERPIMARVFYNRIEQGMKLESCATIQYILGTPKEFLTNADTQIESPYNTYLHEGLPPGPICNPRLASIEAALYPADNDYLYFVLSSALDGSHKFSKDYNEFLKNKDAYYAAVGNN